MIKRYRHKRFNTTKDVIGEILVEATDGTAAEGVIRRAMYGEGRRPMQTIDPRIKWEEEPGDVWEYEDFTFDVVAGEAEETFGDPATFPELEAASDDSN